MDEQIYHKIHDITIDLRKALMKDEIEMRESIANQISRLYKLLRERFEAK